MKTHWTKEMFLSRVGSAEAKAEPAQARLAQLRRKAAVLSYFDPRTLSSDVAGAADREVVQEFLKSSATIVYDDKRRPQWRLKDDVRKRVLQQLGPAEMKELVAATPQRPLNDPAQQIFERYLSGEAPPLEIQTAEELKASLEVTGWLVGVLPDLPDAEEINLQLERHALLQPMRDLAGDRFFGRERELERLRDYVGVLPPSSKLESVFRSVREFLSLRERPPLMIHGPGGIGKSTLLSKLILEHARLDESNRLPYAYLNFERPDLSLDKPLSLPLEILDQISRQLRCDRKRAQALRTFWWERLRKTQGGEVRPDDLRELSGFLESGFQIDLRRRPLLMVLDTFEEVQYRTPHLMETLWKALVQLQERWPQLRTVLAGRSADVGFKTEELALGDFSAEAAREYVDYLTSKGTDSEEFAPLDAEAADLIVKKVGGNPLTLKLATEAYRKAGASGLRSLETRRLFFFQLEEGVIQGQLYLRILEHIHNPDVRRLAHPGLILRWITREIIREVLAEPCGVEVPSDERADELFSEFAREVALVRPAGEGVLQHRPDIRRSIVPMLRQTKPEVTREIQARAVDYYQSRPSLEDRVEEVYHRLMLGQSTVILDERWMAGIEPFLRDSLPELPTLGQTYLASRLGLELDREVWRKADLVQWERNVDSRLEELIRLGRHKEGLALLQERRERSDDSVLYLREAQIWRGLGDYERAEKAVQKGIDAGLALPEHPHLAALLLLLAEIQESTGRFEAALQSLERAVGRSGESPLLLLEIHLRRFDALRLANPEARAETAAERLCGEVAESLARASDEELARDPDLALRLALAFGALNQGILARLVRFLRLPALTGQDVQPAIEAWMESETRGWPGEPVERTLRRDERPQRMLRSLEKLLRERPLPRPALAGLVEGLRRASRDEPGRAARKYEA